MNDDLPYKVTHSKIAYRNPWITVHEDAITHSDGSEGIYGYVEINESVAILAVNSIGEICLIESYRHPFRRWFWELPGGGGDSEDLLAAAQRELVEEAGITATQWYKLGKARVCNGISTEYQTNFLAMGLTIIELVEREEETRAQKFVSLTDLDRMIMDGEFQDNQSITVLYMYKNWLQNQK